jgi:hypothetical protein
MNFFHRYIAVIFTNQIFPLLNPLVNTDRNIFTAYIEGIAVGIFTRNKSINILQRIENKLMQISLQLIDKITYNYPISDILNNIKKIINKLKRVMIHL